MTFVPATGIVEVTAQFSQSGRNCTNVFHVGTNPPAGGALDIGEVNAYLEEFALDYIATVLPEISQDVTLVGFHARDLSVSGGAVADYASGASGGRAEASEPPGVAAVISWRTGYSGPAYRGRTFQPGVDENHTDADGSLQPSYRGALQTAYDDFIVALAAGAHGSQLYLYVISRYHVVGGVLTPRVAALINYVQGGTVRNYVHSQRRRNQRG